MGAFVVGKMCVRNLRAGVFGRAFLVSASSHPSLGADFGGLSWCHLALRDGENAALFGT
jgi:hypothetical protein